jgi:hypothetical protein
MEKSEKTNIKLLNIEIFKIKHKIKHHIQKSKMNDHEIKCRNKEFRNLVRVQAPSTSLAASNAPSISLTANNVDSNQNHTSSSSVVETVRYMKLLSNQNNNLFKVF